MSYYCAYFTVATFFTDYNGLAFPFYDATRNFIKKREEEKTARIRPIQARCSRSK